MENENNQVELKLSRAQKIWKVIDKELFKNEEFTKNFSEENSENKSNFIAKHPNKVTLYRELHSQRKDIWIEHSYIWTHSYSEEEWVEFKNEKFEKLIQKFEINGQAFDKLSTSTEKKIEYFCILDNNVKCSLILFDKNNNKNRGIGVWLGNCDFKDERKIKSLSKWVSFFSLILRDIVEEYDIHQKSENQILQNDIHQEEIPNNVYDINSNGNSTKKKYRYTIEIKGKGGELVFGSIDDDTWNYIEKEFDGDAESYCEALDGGEVPDEYCLAANSYELHENDNLGHLFGWFSNISSTITIKDEDYNEILEIDTSDLVEVDENYENYMEPESSEDCTHHYMFWLNCEKGYMSCTLELDEPFDIKKLKYTTENVLYDNDDSRISIIRGVQYGAYNVHFDIDDTYETSSPEVTFYSVQDPDDYENDDDE